MTRFQEALLFGLTLIVVWGVLLNQVSQHYSSTLLLHTQLLPFYALVLFGALSAAIVLYRVFTFNDCPEANLELQKQIKQAYQDLQQKGLVISRKDKKDD